MNRWFRFYDDAVNDPKVQMLPSDLFKAWVNLLCVASKNNGWLPATDAIAYVLRMPEKKIVDLIDELLQRSLLDDYDGRLTPHNWCNRQHKSDVSTNRVKRFRELKSDVSTDRVKRFQERKVKRDETVSSAVSETPPETESDTEVEKKEGSEPEEGSGAEAPPPIDQKTQLFRRGREILGPKSGGSLTAKLLHSIGKEDDPNTIAKARSRLEEASTKVSPAEWLGRVINGPAAVLTPDGQPYPDGII